jgi:hypothetical protein
MTPTEIIDLTSKVADEQESLYRFLKSLTEDPSTTYEDLDTPVNIPYLAEDVVTSECIGGCTYWEIQQIYQNYLQSLPRFHTEPYVEIPFEGEGYAVFRADTFQLKNPMQVTIQTTTIVNQQVGKAIKPLYALRVQPVNSLHLDLYLKGGLSLTSLIALTYPPKKDLHG